MTELSRWMPQEELALISVPDQQWLTTVFEQFGGYPSLEQLWTLMDEPWIDFKCDPNVMDARIGQYYAHPVWLLNGLFVEQHSQSIENRFQFCKWVVTQAPIRVGELGGGFGGLARMIGASIPDASVEIIEPHPTAIAVSRAEKTPNVRYKSQMEGEYDILVATDVFEHVPDPVQLFYDTAQHLRVGGSYLVANCFYPVILCHLPQTFYLRHGWHLVASAMGLKPTDKVSYGQAYIRTGALSLDAARLVERRLRLIWPLVRHLPGKIARPLSRLMCSA